MSDRKNHPHWHESTQLIHGGSDSDRHDGIVNPPIYRASTILYKTLAHLMGEKSQEFSYGRHGTIPSNYLRQSLTTLEQGYDSLLMPSGLSAITCVFLAVLTDKPKCNFLVGDNTYKPVKDFLTHIIVALGGTIIYFDTADLDDVTKKTEQHQPAMIWLENPGSETFEVADLVGITKLAKAKNILVGVDNTWSAGVLHKPLTLGADFSVHSLTKYICGHADELMGAVIVNNKQNFALLQKTTRALGISVSADGVYTMLRGLRTLKTRLAAHEVASQWMIEKLQQHDKVVAILHPSCKSAVGHEHWQRDFHGSAGVFGMAIKPLSKKQLADLVDGFSLFRMGYSWGSYESLVVPQLPHRSVKAWELTGAWDDATTPTLLRVQIGLEDKEDLWQDLTDGFARAYP